MNATMITPESIQANVQRVIAETSISLLGLSAVSGIPLGDLRAKLAAERCTFTVAQLANLMIGISRPLEELFAPVETPRPLVRTTEPGTPEQDGIGGGL